MRTCRLSFPSVCSHLTCALFLPRNLHQADIIVWDFAERKLLHKFCLHKRKVQGLAFSANDAYLASLGGQDDGRVALWDLSTGKALAGAETGNGRSGMANCVAFASTDDNVFTTGM